MDTLWLMICLKSRLSQETKRRQILCSLQEQQASNMRWRNSSPAISPQAAALPEDPEFKPTTPANISAREIRRPLLAAAGTAVTFTHLYLETRIHINTNKSFFFFKSSHMYPLGFGINPLHAFTHSFPHQNK